MLVTTDGCCPSLTRHLSNCPWSPICLSSYSWLGNSAGWSSQSTAQNGSFSGALTLTKDGLSGIGVTQLLLASAKVSTQSPQVKPYFGRDRAYNVLRISKVHKLLKTQGSQGIETVNLLEITQDL